MRARGLTVEIGRIRIEEVMSKRLPYYLDLVRKMGFRRCESCRGFFGQGYGCVPASIISFPSLCATAG
jgi:hypothetical protein